MQRKISLSRQKSSPFLKSSQFYRIAALDVPAINFPWHKKSHAPISAHGFVMDQCSN